MINLGHHGLNRLPEETKGRIADLVAHFYRINPASEVTSIILLTHHTEDFDSVLEKLEAWRSLRQESAIELIDQLNTSLKEELLASRAP
jgi:hypothetical protein